MHNTITMINKVAIIIIYHHGINLVTLPKVKRGGDFIHDENKTNTHAENKLTHMLKFK
jgi:hypothetical protein